MNYNYGAFTQSLKDNYYKLSLIFLLFLLLAFDRDLAMIYILIQFADYVWYKSDNFISFPIIRSSGIMVYLESAAALGIFLVVSNFLVSYLSPQSLIAGGTVTQGAQSIFHLLATSTPILKGSVLLTFLGWALIVPLIETTFFNGRLLEGLAAYSETIINRKVSLDKWNINLITIVFVVASLFTLFHLTSKGLDSTALLITFIFSVISSALVIHQKQLSGTIFMHVVTNSAAVASTYNWI